MLKEKEIQFAQSVAAGMGKREAYTKYIAVNKKATPLGLSALASKLLRKPEVKHIIANYQDELAKQMMAVHARVVADEFRSTILTTTELDAYHSAIIQGKTEVEEVVPRIVYREILNKSGEVVGKERSQDFVRVKRPPNIREKQISMDALYRRRGDYVVRPKGWSGGGSSDDDSGDEVPTTKMIQLSNGDTVPFQKP